MRQFVHKCMGSGTLFPFKIFDSNFFNKVGTYSISHDDFYFQPDCKFCSSVLLLLPIAVRKKLHKQQVDKFCNGAVSFILQIR